MNEYMNNTHSNCGSVHLANIIMLTHGEIAHELQVSRTSITSDIQYLRNQAKESIKEYVQSTYLSSTRYVFSALDTILKHALEILQDSDG